MLTLCHEQDGDQSDPAFLKGVVDKYSYDIIIDDCSHHPDHQIISLMYLYAAIKPGGLYVIEDIESSYWNRAGAEIYGYPIVDAGLSIAL